GQQGARLHRLAVQMDGARSARRRVAADVRARETDGLAYVVHEERARFHIALVLRAVDGHRDFHGASTPHVRPSDAVGTSSCRDLPDRAWAPPICDDVAL